MCNRKVAERKKTKNEDVHLLFLIVQLNMAEQPPIHVLFSAFSKVTPTPHKGSDEEEPESNVDVFPKLGVTVQFLDEFVECCGGRDAVADLSTTDVCDHFVKPYTSASRLSLCDHLDHCGHSCVGRATVFISHAWKYRFMDVVEALKTHFESSLDTVVWFDLFSVNQHGTTERDFTWWSTTFLDAIKLFGHTVMVLSPWHDPVPLTRAWCLWELYSTVKTECRFEVALSERDRSQLIADLERDCDDKLNEMKARIDVARSQCYLAEDREKIFKSIASQSVSFNALNATAFSALRQWIVDVLRRDCESFESRTDRGNEYDSRLASKWFTLAHAQLNQGNYDTSLTLYGRCYAHRKALFGERHPDTLTAMHYEAYALRMQGKYSRAQKRVKECLDLRKEVLGEFDGETLRSMNLMASLFALQGLYDKAMLWFEKCLELTLSSLGETHTVTQSVMNNLANVYMDLGMLDEAQKMHENCLDIRRSNLGERHPHTLNSLNNLALTLKDSGDFVKARPLYEQCFELRKTVLGETHPESLDAMINLANLYCAMDLEELAQPLYEHCSKLRTSAYGDP